LERVSAPFAAAFCSLLTYIRQRPTILSDTGTDMARNFYSHDVYSIADGAGNVVVNVVAWAREAIGPPPGMTDDGLFDWEGEDRFRCIALCLLVSPTVSYSSLRVVLPPLDVLDRYRRLRLCNEAASNLLDVLLFEPQLLRTIPFSPTKLFLKHFLKPGLHVFLP
jgi:hypothetical protein